MEWTATGRGDARRRGSVSPGEKPERGRAWRDAALARRGRRLGAGAVRRGCWHDARRTGGCFGATHGSARLGVRAKHFVEHLVCTWLAASWKKKVNRSRAGLADWGGEEERRGVGPRGKREDEAQTEQYCFTISQGFGIEF